MTEKWNVEDWRKHQQKINNAKQSKFKAIPGQASDGKKFDSQYETRYYNRLKLLKQAGEITDFEVKKSFVFEVNDILISTYEVDFIVYYPDGRVEHIDTKSTATVTPLYKIKKNLMLALYGITLIEVFDEELKK